MPVFAFWHSVLYRAIWEALPLARTQTPPPYPMDPGIPKGGQRPNHLGQMVLDACRDLWPLLIRARFDVNFRPHIPFAAALLLGGCIDIPGEKFEPHFASCNFFCDSALQPAN
ncbi:hypothetical protein XFF6990_380023 [Xanthomonas citri pv. fuscans]|nr:hypothetical protein XFF6990_380023 [Xanthomonas citri pv. fuscans]